MLPSLFDFRPEHYSLPGFDDMLRTPHGDVIAVDPPWALRGTVVKGFGRGSKELGIPTANLDSASLQVSHALPSALCAVHSLDDLGRLSSEAIRHAGTHAQLTMVPLRITSCYDGTSFHRLVSFTSAGGFAQFQHVAFNHPVVMHPGCPGGGRVWGVLRLGVRGQLARGLHDRDEHWLVGALPLTGMVS